MFRSVAIVLYLIPQTKMFIPQALIRKEKLFITKVVLKTMLKVIVLFINQTNYFTCLVIELAIDQIQRVFIRAIMLLINQTKQMLLGQINYYCFAIRPVGLLFIQILMLVVIKSNLQSISYQKDYCCLVMLRTSHLFITKEHFMVQINLRQAMLFSLVGLKQLQHQDQQLMLSQSVVATVITMSS